MGLRRFIGFLECLCVEKHSPKQDFTPEYWHEIRKRKYYLRAVMENPEYLGRSKSEIAVLLGSNACKYLGSNRWAYSIEMKGRKEYVLAFYFEDDLLIDIRNEYEHIC